MSIAAPTVPDDGTTPVSLPDGQLSGSGLFDAVLFDLDGTLVDPAAGITGGIVHARRAKGLPASEEPERMAGPLIGDPHHFSWVKSYYLVHWGCCGRPAERTADTLPL